MPPLHVERNLGATSVLNLGAGSPGGMSISSSGEVRSANNFRKIKITPTVWKYKMPTFYVGYLWMCSLSHFFFTGGISSRFATFRIGCTSSRCSMQQCADLSFSRPVFDTSKKFPNIIPLPIRKSVTRWTTLRYRLMRRKKKSRPLSLLRTPGHGPYCL